MRSSHLKVSEIGNTANHNPATEVDPQMESLQFFFEARIPEIPTVTLLVKGIEKLEDIEATR